MSDKLTGKYSYYNLLWQRHILTGIGTLRCVIDKVSVQLNQKIFQCKGENKKLKNSGFPFRGSAELGAPRGPSGSSSGSLPEFVRFFNFRLCIERFFVRSINVLDYIEANFLRMFSTTIILLDNILELLQL